MAKAKTAVKEKPAKKKRGAVDEDALSERLLFDIDRFDDVVMATNDLDSFRSGARVSMENFGQLKLFSTRHRFIIGVDEVGRGCLAGPVVAAAVVLPGIDKSSEIASRLKLLNDSKKLPAATREALSKTIRGCAHFAIGEASVEEIDTINIFHASLLAMKRAVMSLVSSAMLDLKEAVILIDGKWRLPDIEAYQLPVIKGDSKSASIAAASIVAKVHRDAFMVKLGEEFPHYNWRSNKGYGALEHRLGIQEHGMTVWHRRSFKCLPYDDDEDFDEECEDAENALKAAIRKVSKKKVDPKTKTRSKLGSKKVVPNNKKSTSKTADKPARKPATKSMVNKPASTSGSKSKSKKTAKQK